jgi:hypothetical protein
MTKKKRFKIIEEIEKLVGSFRFHIYKMNSKELKEELALRRKIHYGKYIKDHKF